MYWNLLKEVVYSNWPMIVIFLVTMSTLRVLYLIHHKNQFSLYKETFNMVSIVYILLLFQLLTNSEANVGGGYNIMPFTEMTRYTFGSNLFMLNVVGNIVIFIPFGFFVTYYLKSRKFFLPLIVTAIVSTCVEFIQLGIGRSFDIDDIILNIGGAMIGYIVFITLKSIKRHLPNIFQKDRLYNIVCIIILVVFVFYILKLTGVLA